MWLVDPILKSVALSSQVSERDESFKATQQVRRVPIGCLVQSLQWQRPAVVRGTDSDTIWASLQFRSAAFLLLMSCFLNVLPHFGRGYNFDVFVVHFPQQKDVILLILLYCNFVWNLTSILFCCSLYEFPLTCRSGFCKTRAPSSVDFR